jgi:hypothetical protein
LIKLAALDLDGVRKRAISEDREDDEPVKKKQKIMKVVVKGKKKFLTKVKQDEVVLVDTELYQAPAVTSLYTSGFDSSDTATQAPKTSRHPTTNPTTNPSSPACWPRSL